MVSDSTSPETSFVPQLLPHKLDRPAQVEELMTRPEIHLDKNGNIIELNQKMYSLLHLPPQTQAKGLSFTQILSPNSLSTFTDSITSHSSSNAPILGLMGGSTLTFLKCDIVLLDGITYISGTDVTQEIGQVDSLTSLFTRTTAEIMITNCLAERGDYQHGIIQMDIDGLKQVNDQTEGHHNTGDKIIKVAGMLIRHFFREGDIKSRWGGDEFLVLLKDITGLEDLQIKIESMERVMKVLNGAEKSILLGKESAVVDSIQSEIAAHNLANPNDPISISAFGRIFHLTSGYSLVNNSNLTFDDAKKIADKMLYDQKPHLTQDEVDQRLKNMLTS